MHCTTGIYAGTYGGSEAVEAGKISLGKEVQDSSSQPLAYEQPLVFDQKRRSGCCGCCLWLIFLILLAGAGGAVSWHFLDSNDKMLIKNGLGSLINGTPLDFLRNYIMPCLETKPPLPPVNESGDHGVITLPAKPQAPAVQDAIQPKAAEDEAAGQDKAGEGDVVYQQIDRGDGTAAKALPKEDTRVHPLFIQDLASYIVSRYRPLSDGKGSVSISVQSLNQRYAKTPVGLEAKADSGSREALLRYCFTPSMIQGLYAIYSDTFLQAVADAASEKKLGAQEQSALFQALGSRCLILASGLEAVAGMPDLGRRLSELDQADQACVLSNRQLLDARFDLERARDTGAGQQELANARETVQAAQRALQEAARNKVRTQELLIAALRSQSGTSLNEDSLLYLARWVGRRMKENNEAQQGALASSQMLKALARRCATAAREGLPDVSRQNTDAVKQADLPKANPGTQNRPAGRTQTNLPQQPANQ